ncbi:hypothetical protein LG288_06045 [Idiomarina seosinensis]|uniref:hypothetical protein n=1 Tax=Idiomarina seosinensis TaxID=281739 RepID=UPI003850B7A5
MQANNDNQQTTIIGGNLTDALNGRYQLSLGDVFKQTFDLTRKHWVPLFLGFIAFMGILLIISLVALSILPASWVEQFADPEQQIAAQALVFLSILGAAVGAPFWGGLILMGIRHSVDIPSKATDMFNGFRKAGPLIATLVATSLLTQVSILLLTELHWLLGVLAQIYLTVAFAFALPLVIERDVSPLNAIFYSVRIVNYKLPIYIILLFAISGLLIISSLLFFIPLIYVVPLIFNLCGVVYKDVVGVSIRLDDQQIKDNDNGPWQA